MRSSLPILAYLLPCELSPWTAGSIPPELTERGEQSRRACLRPNWKISMLAGSEEGGGEGLTKNRLESTEIVSP